MNLNYETWNPSQGDFNKRNLARDSEARKKKEKKQRGIKMGLFALYTLTLFGSLYYFI